MVNTDADNRKGNIVLLCSHWSGLGLVGALILDSWSKKKKGDLEMKQGFTGQKCPRCGGNMYFDIDYFVEGSLISWFKQQSCLQCGYIKYESEASEAGIAGTGTSKQKILVPV
jgi:predicted nucleic-acid-binding Zn-ribbon protein